MRVGCLLGFLLLVPQRAQSCRTARMAAVTVMRAMEAAEHCGRKVIKKDHPVQAAGVARHSRRRAVGVK